MFGNLIAILSLIQDFVINVVTSHRAANTPCKLLMRCYLRTEELAQASESLAQKLDRLPLGRKIYWTEWTRQFEVELVNFNRYLKTFVDAYGDISRILKVYNPNLDSFMATVWEGKGRGIESFARWYDENSLNRDGEKLSMRIMKLDWKGNKKPFEPSEIYEEWSIDVSTVEGKHEAVRRVNENIEVLYSMKDKLRQFIMTHCTINEIL